MVNIYIKTFGCALNQSDSELMAGLLHEEGHKIVPHKTSRTILNEWGYTLNEVHKSSELTKKFQDEVLVRHHLNNIDAINSTDLFFTERYCASFTPISG